MLTSPCIGMDAVNESLVLRSLKPEKGICRYRCECAALGFFSLRSHYGRTPRDSSGPAWAARNRTPATPSPALCRMAVDAASHTSFAAHGETRGKATKGIRPTHLDRPAQKRLPVGAGLSPLGKLLSKFTQAARGESCIACGRMDETIVLGHRNEGKAMGKKLVPDWLALDLCYLCHTEYDQGRVLTRDEKRAWFNENYPKQIARWMAKGILK